MPSVVIDWEQQSTTHFRAIASFDGTRVFQMESTEPDTLALYWRGRVDISQLEQFATAVVNNDQGSKGVPIVLTALLFFDSQEVLLPPHVTLTIPSDLVSVSVRSYGQLRFARYAVLRPGMPEEFTVWGTVMSADRLREPNTGWDVGVMASRAAFESSIFASATQDLMETLFMDIPHSTAKEAFSLLLDRAQRSVRHD